jgi:SAM-dependent methyltransferase
MPDEKALSSMYGASYFEGDPHNHDWVRDYLATLPVGVFIDYGCGDGGAANEAYKLGWRSIGIEYSSETVELLQSRYPFEIIKHGRDVPAKADALHLADVTEHLTDLDGQFKEILKLVKPGGIILISAPLEGNENLWKRMVMLSWSLKSTPPNGAPFHVTWATTEGYQRLFERHNLETIRFDVEQICFPAPYKIRECASLKKAAFYLLRRLSQLFASRSNGNRFFFVGRKV